MFDDVGCQGKDLLFKVKVEGYGDSDIFEFIDLIPPDE